MTLMTYVPGGVPPVRLLPPLLVWPPPQAMLIAKPANRNTSARLFLLLPLSEPKNIPPTPISGTQSAYDSAELDPEGDLFAVGPVVLTVRTAGVPATMEPGLIEHFGAITGDGCTEHERATEPLTMEPAPIFTVAVDEPPALTVLGVSPEEESEKVGASVSWKVVPRFEVPPAVVVP